MVSDGTTLVMMIWGVIGVAVVGVLMALGRFKRRRDEGASLGSVSHRWVAEHRLGQVHNQR